MRIMFDTNVLISMILFPSASFDRIMNYITQNHQLILSSFVVDELFAVVDRKFPSKRKDIDKFLLNLSFELVYTPFHIKGDLFKIRDMKDYPVLYTAIIENVDIFITGDKDFADVKVEKPIIVTPMDFLRRYCLT